MTITGRWVSALTFASLMMVLGACAPAQNAEEPLAYMGDDGEVEPTQPPDVPPPADRTTKETKPAEPPTEEQARQAILAKYQHLDPEKLVPRPLLEKAVLHFDANQTIFANKNYIGVVDFSKRSSKARYWIITLKTGAVWPLHVAHGRGSDSNGDGFAEKFSNVHGSNASSVGIYRTAETYDSSKFGYSLRVDGLSKTNSNVRARAIVIHPAWYVVESNVVQGRTAGCLGVAKNVSKTLIDRIKNGSMILVDTSGVR